MPAMRLARGRIRLTLIAIAGLSTIGLAGCDGPAQEMQLPEEARKSVERRKVDFQPRPAKSQSGTRGSKNPSGK
jgi:hypothetical protein